MSKKLVFVCVLSIVLLGWSLPILAAKPELTTSYKTNATNISVPANPNPILNQSIIWNNGSTISSGRVESSQKDTVNPFVSQGADDFQFTQNMLVTGIHWWGYIWNPIQEFDPMPFYIYIYADNGTGNYPTGGGMPDPSSTALATYFFPSVTGLLQDANGFREYNVNLSPSFDATAGVKYWIAIQAKLPFPPQWGWAQTSGIQLHQAVQGFPLLGMNFWTNINTPTAPDMAFYLTGEQAESLYWKPSYPDYAPHGMPDLDQHQDNWYKYETSEFSFCGPVAVANCFKWFDSKYNNPPGVPGDGMDMFPLVREYIDALGGMLGPWDDHDPYNMNHLATPWLFGGTPPPPPTLQPFMPGHQNPGMPPWGELVERLVYYFNTDGVRTGYCQHSGTNVMEIQQGIQAWFESEHFPNGSTLADTFCEKTWQMPTFAEVGKLVEKCEDVILLLGFWFNEGPGEQKFIRGDINGDGVVNGNDAIIFCQWGVIGTCNDAADIDDDGMIDIGDCVYLIQFLYQGGNPPPPPFPNCGPDPSPDSLGCASFASCPSASWRRVGGHYVTVAGVNSRDLLIGISDPAFDNAEMGAPGNVGDGQYITHSHGSHDATVHNDEGNVSHDIYPVEPSSPVPAGLWILPDYPVSLNPAYCYDFSLQNIPDEFVGVSAPWPGAYPIVTVVEYAVQISPWDYRGDINIPGGDGVVDIGDVVFLINYLFKSGPVPNPLSEGDVNCDNVVDIGDVVTLINYLFKHGNVPKCCD